MPTKTQTMQFTNKVPFVTPSDGFVKASHIRIDFPTVAPAVGDLIELATIPAGVRVEDFAFFIPAVDTNGAPTFQWSLGIENAGGTDLGEVWATGITAGGATTVYRAANATHLANNTASDRVLAMKVTALAATYNTSGVVGRSLVYLKG
ncbi:MAG: hypothetical protein QM762_08795 [Chryseolinea sp.]